MLLFRVSYVLNKAVFEGGNTDYCSRYNGCFKSRPRTSKVHYIGYLVFDRPLLDTDDSCVIMSTKYTNIFYSKV